eukprot:1150548-Pelagomonas_calceolata.AAC.1
MLPPSVLTCPAYEKRTRKMGLPASVHALQISKNLSVRCSNIARTLQDPLSINITPPSETLQICPQTEEVIATRYTEPDSEPPRKRKYSRYRASITPVHRIHNLLPNTTQSNVLPPPLMRTQKLGTLSTSLPEIYRSRVACISYTDGKYVGMMTHQYFDVLYKAFHTMQSTWPTQ